MLTENVQSKLNMIIIFHIDVLVLRKIILVRTQLLVYSTLSLLSCKSMKLSKFDDFFMNPNYPNSMNRLHQNTSLLKLYKSIHLEMCFDSSSYKECCDYHYSCQEPFQIDGLINSVAL